MLRKNLSTELFGGCFARNLWGKSLIIKYGREPEINHRNLNGFRRSFLVATLEILEEIFYEMLLTQEINHRI